ncbi:uncharacterized protein N7482_000135 [Penicillium canariense]|uniref:Uncharacterized protein n=1 Tax=Penicillium canariense TaxID=189055 RepID=A0A9W9LRR0_9EURO|nr:uncharacterized protein N7482_000135 [Penicillium canariense]KAJ5174258.1 hypothetical protein N7482_000135 [Penicillium canariense]
MTFREKVRRVFQRSSPSKGNGKPNVEYYRRNEVPPSKFRGPFDKAHQKRLAAWSFERAMEDRPRSLDLSLSPCATYDLPGPLEPLSSNNTEVSPDHDGVPIDPALTDFGPDSGSSVPGLADSFRPTGSQSSTVVNSNSESYSGSMMTLLPEEHDVRVYAIHDDPIALLKESIRYTSPIVRAMSPTSPYPKSPRGWGKTKSLPFAPEDLTRALNAVQVCA